MRFASPAEVKAWAMSSAAGDFARYLSFDYDKNPYCTQGARSCWQRGYDGATPYSWEGNVEYDTQYQRGAAMRQLEDGMKEIMQ